MEIHEVIGIGFALGIDCLAVSAGISAMRPPARVVLATCFLFGLFQAGLALAGMAGGTGLAHIVKSPLRFAPPVILFGVGLMMFFSPPGDGGRRRRSLGVMALVGAAISVSLDALGAGVAMGIAGAMSTTAALIIGVISVGMSAVGFGGGAMLASRTAVAEKIGGLILITLATVMLIAGIRA